MQDLVNVSLCKKCSDIHLTIGHVALRLNLQTFGHLAHAVMETATALKSGETTIVQQGIGSRWLLQKMSAN